MNGCEYITKAMVGPKSDKQGYIHCPIKLSYYIHWIYAIIAQGDTTPTILFLK